MASARTLLRLQELLQLACGSCEAVLESINELIGSLAGQSRSDEWWVANITIIEVVLGYSYKAEKQIENAATLCDQEWPGDAEQLRKARNDLVEQLNEINVYYDARRMRPESFNWSEQAELWTILYLRIISADTTCRELLRSESIRVERGSGNGLTEISRMAGALDASVLAHEGSGATTAEGAGGGGEAASDLRQRATANERMKAELAANLELVKGWTARTWARHLGYRSASTITDTQTWKTLALLREHTKAEKAMDRNRRGKPAGR